MIIQNIQEILSFRQNNPGGRGSGLYANDERLIPVYRSLNSLKDSFSELFSTYRGFNFTIEISKGITYFPSIIHICILPHDQKVSDGIYTALCFDKFGRGLVVGCAESVTIPRGLNTKYRNSELIDVDGLRETTKYNNCFVNPKEFYYGKVSLDELIEHIKESMDFSLMYLGHTSYKKNLIHHIDDEDIDEYTPTDDKDATEKVLRNIKRRRGQKKFRDSLLRAYCSKCAISGCEVVDILEAAHIMPYNGNETNHIQNGILLRSDLHTLFDLGYITINANTFRILVHRSLKNSIYYQYHNKPLFSLPESIKERPSKKSLSRHNNMFKD